MVSKNKPTPYSSVVVVQRRNDKKRATRPLSIEVSGRVRHVHSTALGRPSVHHCLGQAQQRL